jgi:hypothetical protein
MNMNLKGIMHTLGAKPGQVMSDPYARAWASPTQIKEAENQDHEVSMAQSALDSIIKAATELKGKIGQGEKDIPAWIQDHITNSENYISQAASNYHEYSTNEAGINGAPRFPSLDGVANESVNEEEIKWNAVENAIINFLKANTKILDKRVKDRDTEGVKGGLKSIISGLTNAQRSLKLESVNEVSYNVKADNAYQFINGATAVLGMYLKDDKLESGAKSTLQRVVKDLEGLRKYFFSRKDESINEAFEVHYSDGIRAAKKFNNEKQAVDFAKDLINNKKGLQFVDVFNAGSGFNSTADTNAIVAWWGKGSYTDNKSKNDSKLAAKKIKESLRLTNLK